MCYWGCSPKIPYFTEHTVNSLCNEKEWWRYPFDRLYGVCMLCSQQRLWFCHSIWSIMQLQYTHLLSCNMLLTTIRENNIITSLTNNSNVHTYYLIFRNTLCVAVATQWLTPLFRWTWNCGNTLQSGQGLALRKSLHLQASDMKPFYDTFMVITCDHVSLLWAMAITEGLDSRRHITRYRVTSFCRVISNSWGFWCCIVSQGVRLFLEGRPCVPITRCLQK